MRYVRFMSIRELEKYADGEVLRNHTNWKDGISKTGSKGFCFFGDSVRPEERIEYLTGVVDMDIVAVFEPIREKKLKKSYGMYRDPKKSVPNNIFDIFLKKWPMAKVPEYCTEEYSMNDMKLVKAGKIISTPLRKIEWVTVEERRQERNGE